MNALTQSRLFGRSGIVTALIALASLAGCLTDDGDDAKSRSENAAPNAELSVDRSSAFKGEPFAFDARASSDPDGNITSWRFDFGDDQVMEVRSSSMANASHRYAEPGEYTVTLVVIDDGGENTGSLVDSASLRVAVNDHHDVGAQVIYAAPANSTTAGRFQYAFNTTSGADRFNVNVTAESVLVVGSSDVQLRVLDPSGDVLAERTVTVMPGERKMILIEDEDLSEAGNHTLEVTAKSGGARVAGTLEVYYDEGL